MKYYKSNKKKIINYLFFLSFFFFLPFNIVQADDSPLKIRVGIFQNKPIVFQDELGNAQGLYIDLLNEVAKQENWQVEFIFDSWTNNLERLKQNDINLMTSIAYTKERDSYIDFSQENVLTMWGQVYIGKDSSIQNILDLDGLKVVILRDGINGINFQELCKAFDIKIEFLVKDNYEDGAKLVEMGKADACVINNVHGYELEKEYEIMKSPIMFNPFKLLFAVPEGKYNNILNILDSQLKGWKQDDFWTIKEHIIHLDYVQDIIFERIYKFKNEESPVITPYFPENNKIDNNKFNTINDILNSYKSKRNKQIELIKELKDSDINKEAKHDQYKKYNIELILNHLLFHDYWHMYRIEELWLTKDEHL